MVLLLVAGLIVAGTVTSMGFWAAVPVLASNLPEVDEFDKTVRGGSFPATALGASPTRCASLAFLSSG